ncbi:MAG TPA: nitroreductase/quinone reductase family protein [Lacisediminihabitans sp.]|uniref:nitroreductase/quinone reductase family protein n=1 Tax=Lacisediminihabitans sp. TaxID=2787631 RepID=UPI002ED7FF50
MPSLVRGVRIVVARFSRTIFFRRVGPTVMPPLEKGMAWLTRGRVQMSGLLVPSLVLYTIGAKSGIERETALMYCPEGRNRMLVTGSNFARDSHPAWTVNLMVNPDAAVRLHGRRIPVRATLIGDDEREEVWRFIERQWPGYRGYERASGRILRIFRLEPR